MEDSAVLYKKGRGRPPKAKVQKIVNQPSSNSRVAYGEASQLPNQQHRSTMPVLKLWTVNRHHKQKLKR
jgi:hypothetical protein